MRAPSLTSAQGYACSSWRGPHDIVRLHRTYPVHRSYLRKPPKTLDLFQAVVVVITYRWMDVCLLWPMFSHTLPVETMDYHAVPSTTRRGVSLTLDTYVRLLPFRCARFPQEEESKSSAACVRCFYLTRSSFFDLRVRMPRVTRSMARGQTVRRAALRALLRLLRPAACGLVRRLLQWQTKKKGKVSCRWQCGS